MLLSANWGEASIIALLGFLLVVVLLAFLVLVLVLFGKIMIKSVKPAKTAAPKASASASNPLSDEELVAIALALKLAQEPEHDKETKVLTIKPVVNSAWASKTFGINNLIR